MGLNIIVLRHATVVVMYSDFGQELAGISIFDEISRVAMILCMAINCAKYKNAVQYGQ